MPNRRALRIVFELALTLALVAGAVTLGYAADPPPDSPAVGAPRAEAADAADRER